MSFPVGLNNKTKKNLKKLRVWMHKIQTYVLFQIGNNADHTLQDLMKLPLGAAISNTSIESESLHEDIPSADVFYHHANNKLDKKEILKMCIRYAAEIVKLIKNIFMRSNFTIAIDFTEDPYYGDKENFYVVGGQRKNSTNDSFRRLTAAIAEEGFRFVLFAYPVSKDDHNDALLVEEAIRKIRKLGITIGKVLLDREFYNSKIIFLCNYFNIDYIIPAKKDSKVERKIEELKKAEKKFPIIVENYEIEDQLTNLLLMEDKNDKGEPIIYGFITNIEVEKFRNDPEIISECYRKRWDIENANKFQDAFNIHTNSTNGLVRYFFFVLTVLLHNFWVLVNLFGKTYALGTVSLTLIKEVACAMLGLAPAPLFKHAQRKLWVEILLG
jgi:putative transposase